MLLSRESTGPENAVSSIADIQYAILKTYLDHSSQKKAIQESALAARTEEVFSQLGQLEPASTKSLRCSAVTEITTASSFSPRFKTEQFFSPRERDRRLFKRKGPRGINRGLDEASDAAVQEVREMCSAQTAAVVEELVAERSRLGQELFKATMSRKSRQICRSCQLKDAEIDNMAKEQEQLVRKMRQQLESVVAVRDKLSEQNNALNAFIGQKKEQWEEVEQGRRIFQTCRAYLHQRESAMQTRHDWVTRIESSIMAAVDRALSGQGCSRCEILHRMKGQLLDFRRCLQEQGEELDQLYLRHRRCLK